MKLNLPTLDEVNAVRRATPKHQIPTKVERLKERLAEDRKDVASLAKWAKAVKVRDEYLDRYDGKLCQKGAEPHPRRAEAHHIEPRVNQATRYDVRNGVTLSMENHEQVERGELEVYGRTFRLAGKSYVDGRYAKVRRRR